MDKLIDITNAKDRERIKRIYKSSPYIHYLFLNSLIFIVFFVIYILFLHPYSTGIYPHLNHSINCHVETGSGFSKS